MKIVLCNVGMGNLRSVERALVHSATDAGLSITVTTTSDPEAILGADKIVMPGQGAFRDGAHALAGGLGDALREALRRGTPYLGICLGLQLLFETSEESPGSQGLGWFSGRVVRLPSGNDPTTGLPLKIPHMGWNEAVPRATAPGFAMAPDYFYFVHSYVVAPTDLDLTACTTTYGTAFVSAVARDNVFACQFHPEKSQRAGLALLSRFLAS